MLQGALRSPDRILTEVFAPANPLSASAVLLQDCDDNLFSTYYWVELPVGSGCGKVRLPFKSTCQQHVMTVQPVLVAYLWLWRAALSACHLSAVGSIWVGG